ncbi:hypothetical protein Lepto7376_3181 [[Leptolyngbya] sp. PCC 7376]|uniref:DUF3086 domain-containing protein n=1 Tax=[Leptolyngbya] sp. PCC 7376 TaxID=111781 RepID=UPI00029EE783|nr:DUF3086 domain-containing protein [[Leptolyngbya] sp. PCC 7376]AFY39410.1 hypothetical protein Lepto7376_3181 [[Leptolyngbya] sp. PCC 7376]
MSSDPQDRPKLDLKPAPPQPIDLPSGDQSGEIGEEKSVEAIAAPNLPEVAAEIVETESPESKTLKEELVALEEQKAALIEEIASLKQEKDALFNEETGGLQEQMQQFMTQSLQTLEAKQASLQKSVDQLERRRNRIREEMRTTFAGTSQEIAVRVQGFRDYLMGSLQDLVMAAEQLDFPTYDDNWTSAPTSAPEPEPQKTKLEVPQFTKQSFAARVKNIEDTLKQYQMSPDYYGPPWQLRRTFEPIHAERVKKWFFEQGGRGAVRSIGSRLQNILVASASVSVLYNMYGDRLRALILANTPERLGEWRRGLQDCLGISRNDFGPNSGVILFENPNALVQKADRLVEDDRLPLIIIDEAEDNISLSLLQYQLWLAFAPEPQSDSSYFF